MACRSLPSGLSKARCGHIAPVRTMFLSGRAQQIASQIHRPKCRVAPETAYFLVDDRSKAVGRSSQRSVVERGIVLVPLAVIYSPKSRPVNPMLEERDQIGKAITGNMEPMGFEFFLHNRINGRVGVVLPTVGGERIVRFDEMLNVIAMRQ